MPTSAAAATVLKDGVLNLHGHIHNSPHPGEGPRHINMSIEVRDYRPWRLGDALRSQPDFS